MCGIVGIYLKSPELRPRLGEIFSPMLMEMGERGPDSSGVAVYREDDAAQSGKVIAYDPEAGFDWDAIAHRAAAALGGEVDVERVASHVILRSGAGAAALRTWVERNCPDLRITSSGSVLEIYKEVGMPADVLELFSIAEASGTHAVGHTRMATESAVTTEGAHPFNTGDDLCLVHNGSLSNHHRLREWLREHAGIRFQTENDSEVAAGYLTWKLREGATIAEALEAAIRDLDGFYTFAVGTREGFSVLRDPNRVQAGGPGGDRRLGGDGVGVPGAGRSAGRGVGDGLGAEARHRVQLGERLNPSASALPRKAELPPGVSGCDA